MVNGRRIPWKPVEATSLVVSNDEGRPGRFTVSSQVNLEESSDSLEDQDNMTDPYHRNTALIVRHQVDYPFGIDSNSFLRIFYSQIILFVRRSRILFIWKEERRTERLTADKKFRGAERSIGRRGRVLGRWTRHPGPHCHRLTVVLVAGSGLHQPPHRIRLPHDHHATGYHFLALFLNELY